MAVSSQPSPRPHNVLQASSSMEIRAGVTLEHVVSGLCSSADLRDTALLQEFMLPNGQTWVEVLVKGDPSRSERGLVYCKLCRHYDKSNTFGRGYRCVCVQTLHVGLLGLESLYCASTTYSHSNA